MQSVEREKNAARRATREMKTAILVMTLSFVLVLVLAAVLTVLVLRTARRPKA